MFIDYQIISWHLVHEIGGDIHETVVRISDTDFKEDINLAFQHDTIPVLFPSILIPLIQGVMNIYSKRNISISNNLLLFLLFFHRIHSTTYKHSISDYINIIAKHDSDLIPHLDKVKNLLAFI